MNNEETNPSTVNERNTQQSYSERVKNSEEFKKFKIQYESIVETLTACLSGMVNRNEQLNLPALMKGPMSLISDNKGKISIIDILQYMRAYEDSTFSHCLNVGLLSNIISSWLRMSKEDTELATACGLLHDVGMLLLPYTITHKPGKLSDWEFAEVKKHSQMGHYILDKQNVDRRICNAALMHHERCDGSGYPYGLEREQITSFAKIVAIADAFDAMTSPRAYRDPLCPFKVLHIFEKEGIQKYDVTYIMTFLEYIANIYIQNRCRLNDGRIGDIIFINRSQLSRPMIQCGEQYVDLTKTPTLYVECLL